MFSFLYVLVELLVVFPSSSIPGDEEPTRKIRNLQSEEELLSTEEKISYRIFLVNHHHLSQ